MIKIYNKIKYIIIKIFFKKKYEENMRKCLNEIDIKDRRQGRIGD